ncbi:MAG: DUF438 domain-containing protein, partial [Calditrichia bacterium]|nr:DUF438 domain-containing protein [Calditrichia bacterium]
MVKGKKGNAYIEKFREAIDSLTPMDIITVVDMLVKENIPTPELKSGLNKIMNVFYNPIINSKKAIIPKGSFLYYLEKENEQLIIRLNNIKKIIKIIIEKNIPNTRLQNALIELKIKIMELNEFNIHYLKKENILFPYLEKEWDDYRCLPIMWSYHDDIRNNIKTILSLLGSDKPDIKQLQKILGKLFFNMFAIRFREENILYPVALESIPDNIWEKMQDESFDIGFAYIPIPKKSQDIKKIAPPSKSQKGAQLLNINSLGNNLLDFGTGQITLNQAILLLNSLPVDITFVDENDEVRYFSKPKDRFFTRSNAIIGRKVINCHPPESVHMVDELLD